MASITDELLAGAAAAAPPPQGGSATDALLGGQSLRSADPAYRSNASGMVMPGSVDDAAGFWTTMRASMAPDVDAQIRRFAAARFPRMPIDRAVRRYGVVDGNIVYTDDSGAVRREVPSVWESEGPADAFRRIGRNVASGVGPALPQAAGAIAGAAIAPVAPWWSIGAAGGAASVTDYIRQIADRVAAGESISDVDYTNALGHGALAAGAQAIPVAIDRLRQRNPLRVGGQDVTTLRDPANLADYERREALARQYGITVTPGENTNARSLLYRQRQLGRFDESATPMAQFYERRNAEMVPAGFERFAREVSPSRSTAEGARVFASGADDTVRAAVDARRTAARPIYQEVMTPDAVVPQAQWAPLQENRLLASNIQAIRSDPVYAAYRDMPDNSLPVLDLVKRRLDDGIETARRAGENNRARLMTEARDSLVSTLDDIFPRYPDARAAFAGASPEVEALQRGPVGRAAAVAEGFDRFRQAPREVFSLTNADPLTVAQARTAFERAGRTDEWNAGLSAFMRDAFEAASRRENTARGFYNAVYADPRQRAIINAAMTPDQRSAFRDFMSVMEMVRRQPAEGSPTATDLGAREAFAGFGARAAAQGANISNPLTWAGRVREFALNLSAGRNAERIADIITQPGAVEQLRQLRMMSPNQARFWSGLDNLIVNAGVSGAGLRTPGDRDIPDLEDRRGQPQ